MSGPEKRKVRTSRENHRVFSRLARGIAVWSGHEFFTFLPTYLEDLSPTYELVASNNSFSGAKPRRRKALTCRRLPWCTGASPVPSHMTSDPTIANVGTT